MISIRLYQESDAGSAGRLIADTYGQFKLSFASPEQRDQLLGPFRHAESQEPAHRETIARAIGAEMVFVAEHHGEIVGILRGRRGRLASLFVRGESHRYPKMGYKRTTGIRPGWSFGGTGLLY
jgi:hypothetical protein